MLCSWLNTINQVKEIYWLQETPDLPLYSWAQNFEVLHAGSSKHFSNKSCGRLAHFSVAVLSLEESKSKDSLKEIFLMFSVKKYSKKKLMISTWENTLPTLPARLAHMAHFPPCSCILQKESCLLDGFASFWLKKSHKFSKCLKWNLQFLLKQN